MSFEYVYSHLLDGCMRKRLVSWILAASAVNDGPLKQGAQVVLNLIRDCQMPDEDMCTFLDEISKANSKRTIDGFEAACKQFVLHGTRIQIKEDVLLARAVRASTVVKGIIAVMDEEEPVMLNEMITDIEEVKKYLRLYTDIMIANPDSFNVFATFMDELEAETTVPVPLKSAVRLYELLGLKHYLMTYPLDSPAYVFVYTTKPLPAPPGIRIPTIADAGFFAPFRSHSEGDVPGKTMDLRGPDPGEPEYLDETDYQGFQKGLTEVVHGNIPAYFADIIYVPK